jgi:3-oxoacyl-[acyl-carrier-protein] synthase-1
MSAQPLEVCQAGMVSSVGLTAAATCAAIRAKLTNPSPTRFVDGDGEFIMGHAVALEQPWRGIEKLARMAALAIEEVLIGLQRRECEHIPLILCIAEKSRPGRLEGLEEDLTGRIEDLLEVRFAPESVLIPQGRVSAAVGLLQARKLLYEQNRAAALLVGVDSLLTWPTLSALERADRLLTPDNSNGFMPGEGAAAVLLRKPTERSGLICAGVGLATESAHVDTEEPLRGDGLTLAVRNALADAACELHDLDLRITDLSGEQYYFKEASLALNRVLRARKERFELWHPAECLGETGANIGPATLAVALHATRLKYAPGRGVLLHASADGGARVAVVAFGD